MGRKPQHKRVGTGTEGMPFVQTMTAMGPWPKNIREKPRFDFLDNVGGCFHNTNAGRIQQEARENQPA
jgi:hypothetical protein